ncbi:MAG: helix-turn-helix domain-containing protein [Bacteroidales bacterium]
MGRGRKKIDRYEEYIKGKEESIKAACRNGATNTDLSKMLGIGRTTLTKIIMAYPNFREMLKQGKTEADLFVENALYKRAIGYEVEESTTEVRVEKDGSGTTTYVRKTKKHIAPDTTAGIFWLKNRKPDMWREKKDVNIESPFLELMKSVTED